MSTITTTTNDNDRILITGAGIGGLLLAQGLRKNNIPFHVFERDPNMTYRPQGYRIRVSDPGLSALEDCLSPELWQLVQDTAAQTDLGMSSFVATTGEEVPRQQGGGSPRRGGRKPVTVDRQVLRRVLLQGIEDFVSWGKEITHYSEDSSSDNAGVSIIFKDGTSALGRLLVGADGLRSHVRKQLAPHLKPLDTQGRCVYGKTPLTKELRSLLPPNMSVVSDQRNEEQRISMLFEPITFPARSTSAETAGINLPKDYVYWVLVGSKTAFGIEDDETYNRITSEQAADLANHMTEKWKPIFRAVVEGSDVSLTSGLRVCSMPSHIPAWDASPRVTLLGDAAHVMPPTGGIGAVSACADAGTLVKCLVEEGEKGDWVKALRVYEEEMRSRAGGAIADSMRGGKNFGLPGVEEWKETDL